MQRKILQKKSGGVWRRRILVAVLAASMLQAPTLVRAEDGPIVIEVETTMDLRDSTANSGGGSNGNLYTQQGSSGGNGGSGSSGTQRIIPKYETNAKNAENRIRSIIEQARQRAAQNASNSGALIGLSAKDVYKVGYTNLTASETEQIIAARNEQVENLGQAWNDVYHNHAEGISEDDPNKIQYEPWTDYLMDESTVGMGYGGARESIPESVGLDDVDEETWEDIREMMKTNTTLQSRMGVTHSAANASPIVFSGTPAVVLNRGATVFQNTESQWDDSGIPDMPELPNQGEGLPDMSDGSNLMDTYKDYLSQMGPVSNESMEDTYMAIANGMQDETNDAVNFMIQKGNAANPLQDAANTRPGGGLGQITNNGRTVREDLVSGGLHDAKTWNSRFNFLNYYSSNGYKDLCTLVLIEEFHASKATEAEYTDIHNYGDLRIWEVTDTETGEVIENIRTTNGEHELKFDIDRYDRDHVYNVTAYQIADATKTRTIEYDHITYLFDAATKNLIWFNEKMAGAGGLSVVVNKEVSQVKIPGDSWNLTGADIATMNETETNNSGVERTE